jgi:hypothetical protein
MKSRASLFSTVWRKIFPAKKEPLATAEVRPIRLDGNTPENSPAKPKTGRRPSGIEMLEGRIAPATLINATTLEYVDADGDRVTVKFSKALFDDDPAVLTTYINNVFKFSEGSVFLDASLDPGTPQQLQLIDLTKVPVIGFGSDAKSPAQGVSFTISAEKADTLKPGTTEGSVVPGTDGTLDGDGRVNVGAINATSSLNSFGLGKVTIDGDLGQIDAGGPDFAVGLKELKVHSLGAVAGTQGAVTGAPAIESKIFGAIGKITVETDIKNANIYATNATGLKVKAFGKIGDVTVGGALIGNTPIAGSSDNTGLIRSDSSIGKVRIGSGEAGDGIIGGGGTNSGSIIAGTKLTSVFVDGSILGGDGSNSGSVFSSGSIGSVTVEGDVRIAETVLQGGGPQAASIVSGGQTGKVIIAGDLLGGVGNSSGWVSAGGDLKSVQIGGDVVGSGPLSGGIQSEGKLGKVVIEGSVLGGNAFFSGFVQGDLGIKSVSIAGDLKGNPDSTAERTGVIVSGGSIDKVTIAGSVIGGDGRGSGAIQAALSGQGTLGSVVISKQVIGGDGDSSGLIASDDRLDSVIVNGAGVTTALQGGAGRFSGSIYSGGLASSVKLTGDVLGGIGENSGTIHATGLLANVSISGDLKGGVGPGSGSIQSHDDFLGTIGGDMGKITVDGKLLAGTGAKSGAIYADGNAKTITLGGIDSGEFATGSAGAGSASIFTGQGMVNAGDVGAINVLGAMDGRSGDHTLLEIRGSLDTLSVRSGIANGEIHVGDRLGEVKVGVEGRNPVTANISNVLLTAGGVAPVSAKAAVSIASIFVNGDVVDSQILAGYDVDGLATNADAQIGKVTVTGDWTASSLVAGIAAVNGQFGDTDDAAIAGGDSAIVSRIANVLIGGSVTGTDDPTTDSYGFVAQQIGTFRVGNLTIPDVAVHPLADDVFVREVTA